MGFRSVHPRREITQARLTLNLMLLHFALAGSNHLTATFTLRIR